MSSKVRFLTLLSVLALLFVAALPVAAAPDGPRAPLFAANSPNAIRGQYIVVLKAEYAAQLDELLAQTAAVSGPEMRLLDRYDAALNGFAAALPDRAVEALRLHPAVDYIEVDQTVQIDAKQSPATWGIDRIDQRNLPLSNSYTYNKTGSGVTAYIIDTGIRASHNEFGGRAVDGVDKVDGSLPAADCNGHGTHVAGTVGGSTYGVAKGVKLVAVRVLDCSGSGTTSGVIGGIDWVTSNHQEASRRQHEPRAAAFRARSIRGEQLDQ
jgi:aqualysin 1